MALLKEQGLCVPLLKLYKTPLFKGKVRFRTKGPQGKGIKVQKPSKTYYVSKPKYLFCYTIFLPEYQMVRKISDFDERCIALVSRAVLLGYVDCFFMNIFCFFLV